MELTIYSITILAIAFFWSGFARAGLGFGGAGLMYPVALLAVDSILFLVPIICVQLLFFSSITLAKDWKKIDWQNLIHMAKYIAIPFIIGIFGLIELPDFLMLIIVYLVIFYYSIIYIIGFNTENVSRNSKRDSAILLFGGYVSGLTLAGAPMIAAVAAKRLHAEHMRATLFVLWWVLCAIKLMTLFSLNIDLNLSYQLWLLPCAVLGHILGNHAHGLLMKMNRQHFFRILGCALLLLCTTSAARHLWTSFNYGMG